MLIPAIDSVFFFLEFIANSAV